VPVKKPLMETLFLVMAFASQAARKPSGTLESSKRAIACSGLPLGEPRCWWRIATLAMV
jgi:hypothetical protein